MFVPQLPVVVVLAIFAALLLSVALTSELDEKE